MKTFFIFLEFVILFVIYSAYIFVLFNVLKIDTNGFLLGYGKGWGDTTFHLGLINDLATGSFFDFTHTFAAGEPLAYPFFIDFISSLFKRIGFSLYWSFHLPALLFGISLLTIIFILGRNYLKNDYLAIIFLVVVIFGGGLGFIWFFKDLKEGKPFSHEYTHLDNRTGGKLAGFDAPFNIVWITPAISFFSHQRSFIPGAVIGFLILLSILKRKWFGLILNGFLPLIHTHTFFTFSVFVIPTLILIEFLKNISFFKIKKIIYSSIFSDFRKILKIYIISLIIALPQVIFITRGDFENKIEWWPGWMAYKYENVIWFLIKNYGFIFLVWLVILIYYFRNLKLDRLKYLDYKDFLIFSSILIFLVSHLFKFQPWEFDNNKIIFWWWTLAILLSLFYLKDILAKNKKIGIFLLISFVFLVSFSGILDVIGLYKRREINKFGYYSNYDLEMASWIIKNTSPDDIFLVDDDILYFPMITGRKVYLGYPGWLWTHGRGKVVLDRKNKVNRFLKDRDEKQLCLDGVKYILWDNSLINSYSLSENDEEDLKTKMILVYQQNVGNSLRKLYLLKCSN